MAAETGQERYEVCIGSEQAGRRLDRALAEALPQLSRSRIQALIAEGHVRAADGAVTAAAAKVRAGQSS
ncbi:MAG TPA: RNA pseudouridine synthase, partial [Kiloniellaceae bacterium]|nr:RNA pseudouridine synthase [Kiloniellaceae bacterium]